MARRYSRDNRGRFAGGGSSSGGGGKVGATARGGRLRTAAGNKRKTQTTKAAAANPSGTVAGKVKRNPAAAGKIGKQAKPQPRRPDQAEVNIKGRFTGQAGKRMDASIDRAVKQVKASERARLMKPKEQVKAERAARAEVKRQAAAAKPKRTRTAESLRASRAKQIEKRRSITTNPAGERAPAAAKMAANASRTQQRAAAFYKAGGKAAGAKPARAAAKPPRFSAEDAATRRSRAGQLKAMPKDLRRADRTARLAQREVMAKNGGVGGNVVGRGKSGTQSKINSIREGLMRAKGDKTGSIRSQVVKEAKALRARMQTTAAGPRTGAQSGVKRRTTRAAAPRNTTANRTGQSKTLNKFNSRPVGTMVAGKGINLTPSTKRVPLNIAQKASDQAFARTATKAARTRALIPAKTQQKQTTAQRATRAATNQSRVTQAVLAKSSRRPTRKQRRSILTAESAKRFYATKAVDYLKVNVKKPGFRLPRGMR